MTLKNISSFVLSVFITFQASAFEGLSLENAVQTALDNSLQMKRINAVSNEIYWKKWKPLSGFLPHLYVGGQLVIAKTGDNLLHAPATIQPFLPSIGLPNSYLASVATVNLFRGFADWHAYEAFSFAEETVSHERSYAKIEIENGVKMAFYSALGSYKIQSYLEEVLEVLKQLKVATKESVHQGMKTDLVSWSIDDKINQILTEIQTVKASILEARSELNFLMGISEDKRSLTGELAVQEISRDFCVPDLSVRPDVIAMKIQMKAREKEKQAFLGALFPEINFQTSYFYYQDPIGIGGSQPMLNHLSVGVNMIWSVFDGGESIGKYKSAELIELQAKLKWQEQVLKANTELKAKIAELKSLQEDDMFRRQNLEYKNQILDNAKIKNKAGVISKPEYLQAELEVLQSKILKIRTEIKLVLGQLRYKILLGGVTC